MIPICLFQFFEFVFELYLTVVRTYSWLCAQGSLLTALGWTICDIGDLIGVGQWCITDALVLIIKFLIIFYCNLLRILFSILYCLLRNFCEDFKRLLLSSFLAAGFPWNYAVCPLISFLYLLDFVQW